MFTNANYTVFVIALWLFWGAIHTIGLEVWGFPVPLAIVDSLVSNGGLAIGSLILTYPLRYYPDRYKIWMLLLWTFIVTFVWYIAINQILPELPQATEGYLQVLEQSSVLRFAIGFFILFFTILLRWFWLIGEDQRKMKERQQQTEQLAQQTELRTLREQLHPHFLFNTLNSVNALIEIEPKKARRMVQQLSDFLRGTMNKQDKQPVKFGDELTQIKLYLEIEKVRFGHRLEVEFDIDEACNDHLMPPFVLQPLVENAVKFGLYDTTEDVVIQIKSELKDQVVEIKISNPFDAKTSGKLSGTGFGQKSVQRRLFLLYGRTDLFSYTSQNNTYTVTLKIPLL